jgi:hypothetical protein
LEQQHVDAQHRARRCFAHRLDDAIAPGTFASWQVAGSPPRRDIRRAV